MFRRYVPLSQSDFVLSASVHALRKTARLVLHTCNHGVKASRANYGKNCLKLPVEFCVACRLTQRNGDSVTLRHDRPRKFTHARTHAQYTSTDSQHREQRHASVPCAKYLVVNVHSDISSLETLVNFISCYYPFSIPQSPPPSLIPCSQGP